MTQFGTISQALCLANRSGKTYAAIISAPKNATILVANRQEVVRLSKWAKDLERTDLNFVSVQNNEAEIRTYRGPFVLEHYAASVMFADADALVSSYRIQIQKLDNTIRDLHATIEDLQEEIENG